MQIPNAKRRILGIILIASKLGLVFHGMHLEGQKPGIYDVNAR
jgi:cell division protein FtsB